MKLREEHFGLVLHQKSISLVQIHHNSGSSDNDGIPLILVGSKPFFAKQKPRKVFLYGKANTAELKAEVKEISSDLQKKELEYTDANGLWEAFANRLHTAVNAHIPSKIVPERNSTPWISHTNKRLHKRKQRTCDKKKQKWYAGRLG